MEAQQPDPQAGDLSWKLSSHPITLLWFLGLRIGRHTIYICDSSGPLRWRASADNHF